MGLLKYVAIIFYLIKKNVPLYSLVTNINLLLKGVKKINTIFLLECYPVCDCLPLPHCPEWRVSGEGEVEPSLDPLYLLILSPPPCPPSTLL